MFCFGFVLLKNKKNTSPTHSSLCGKFLKFNIRNKFKVKFTVKLARMHFIKKYGEYNIIHSDQAKHNLQTVKD